MESLGGFEGQLSRAPWVAPVVLASALLLTALLEHLQLKLRAAENFRWWASNGRDLLNAFVLVTLWAALRLGGFSGPIAFAGAGVLVIAASLLQSVVERVKALPGWTSYLLMLALGAPAMAAPAEVHALLRAAIERLSGT